MTTLTTVLGLLPLVIMPGAGSELYRGLGAVVLGGLVVSTVFTLFLTPLLLGLSIRFGGFVSRMLGLRTSEPMNVAVAMEGATASWNGNGTQGGARPPRLRAAALRDES
jgi:hypothetical protein